MKSVCMILMLASLFAASALAQPNPDTLWTRTYGGILQDYAISAQQTADGGYILAGITSSFGAGAWDFYLVKTDSYGDTLWTRTYGGRSDDYAYSVQQTADGGYIMAGNTQSLEAMSNDCYLVKTHDRGDTLWTRTYGGSATDVIRSVQQTADGGYILAGWSGFGETDSGDCCLIKTDGQGDTLWTRTYGGNGWEEAHAVRQTTDGGYIIAGNTWSFGAGWGDVYLVRTDSFGDTLWTRTYGGTVNDYARSVQQTTDGGFVVAGFTYSFGATNGDFYLIRTASSGDTLWTRTYGGGDGEEAYCVQETPDGGFVMAGITWSFGVGNGDFYLVKTNSQGDTLWTRTYGGNNGGDKAFYVQQTTDGGYILAGSSSSFSPEGNDFYLVKTGPDLSEAEPVEACAPSQYALYPNFPNPFNPSTRIVYTLPMTSRVSLKVFNLLGQEVASLVNETQPAGTHTISFDGSSLPSGVYLYRLQAESFAETKKMILLK